MQGLVDTDHNVDGSEQFSNQIELAVRAALHRYADRLTRVVVHLSDENGAKSGNADKRCLIEARPSGRQPVIVSHDADMLQVAFDGAAKQMQHLLERIGRSHDHKGGASIRTEYASE